LPSAKVLGNMTEHNTLATSPYLNSKDFGGSRTLGMAGQAILDNN